MQNNVLTTLLKTLLKELETDDSSNNSKKETKNCDTEVEYLPNNQIISGSWTITGKLLRINHGNVLNDTFNIVNYKSNLTIKQSDEDTDFVLVYNSPDLDKEFWKPAPLLQKLADQSGPFGEAPAVEDMTELLSFKEANMGGV